MLLFLHLPVMADTTADIKKVHEAVQKMIPTVPLEAIQPSPLPGLYQVMIPPQMFYISADGRFAIDGDLIDLNTGQNVSTTVRDKMRITAINALGEDAMIVYSPKNPLYTVTVFTDIDCGYCRKLHSEINQYLKAGIKVRYVAYPRAGLGSGSYQKAVNVWCSKDRNDALTRAKLGEDIKAKDCDNPVAQEYELAQRIGLRGTPAIITEQGQVLPGYVPADRLKMMLSAHTASK
ncbi:MAG: DsbC family protein [Thiohalomonadales bacterium]|nr:DsbC family protein [Thiohalomonadales bacterium]